MAQAEITELAVEKWKEEEINKLKNGINHIINNNGVESNTIQHKIEQDT